VPGADGHAGRHRAVGRFELVTDGARGLMVPGLGEADALVLAEELFELADGLAGLVGGVRRVRQPFKE
jgi:hypothetical protein